MMLYRVEGMACHVMVGHVMGGCGSYYRPVWQGSVSIFK